jgi:hypothetical protein
MTVPARYILAAIAFAIAALGFMLLPVDAATARSETTFNGAMTMDGGVGQGVY